MPAPRLHENLIADRIIELIEQNLAADLGLKVVTLDSLEFFPARENPADGVPAVFVKPVTTTLKRITTGETYEVVYAFRIVYVRIFGPNEQILREKIAAAQRIAELLIDNVDLGGLALPSGRITKTLASTVEWDPPEDLIAAQINADMTAAALVFTVEAASRK